MVCRKQNRFQSSYQRSKTQWRKTSRSRHREKFLGAIVYQKNSGVGDKTYMLLRNMGIEKIQTVQQMPVEMMQRVMGENGLMIWKKSNGIDNSAVEPYTERKSLGSERTFDKDTTDIHQLKKTLLP
jgi:DNA polymerase-4